MKFKPFHFLFSVTLPKPFSDMKQSFLLFVRVRDNKQLRSDMSRLIYLCHSCKTGCCVLQVKWYPYFIAPTSV